MSGNVEQNKKTRRTWPKYSNSSRATKIRIDQTQHDNSRLTRCGRNNTSPPYCFVYSLAQTVQLCLDPESTNITISPAKYNNSSHATITRILRTKTNSVRSTMRIRSNTVCRTVSQQSSNPFCSSKRAITREQYYSIRHSPTI